METNELIGILARDPGPVVPLNQILINAGCAAVLMAAILFFMVIGFRTDIGLAIQSGRFLFKFAITLALVLSSCAVLIRIGKPGVPLGGVAVFLLSPLALALVSAVAELWVMPADTWLVRAIGHNALNCLTLIPLLSAAPLACFLYGLRHGAPQNPGLAGLVAGLVSAGIAATFYASNCDDDSPLFVLLWYSVSIAFVALCGYVAGRFMLRW